MRKTEDRGVIMLAFEQINNIWVSLFNEVMELEERAIITEDFKDITNNDMHIIEAVGLGEGNNMSTIAQKISVTPGSLSIAMNSLVHKHYVERRRSETDRRVVNITLTEKGKRAFNHHKEFHDQMTRAALASLSEDEIRALVKSLGNLTKFFREYGQLEEQADRTE